MNSSIRRWAYLLAVVGIAACGEDASSPFDPSHAIVADGQTVGGRLFTTTMTGAAEVPGPGDPDGTGTARITLNRGENLVCWELTVSGIEPATLAHIHIGTVTQSGSPVVTLTPPTSGRSTGCRTASSDLIDDIWKNPSNYYVNVHNATYPGGALRGQL